MDIKLKNFRGRRVAGVLAFFLCVVMFLGSLVGLASTFNHSGTASYGMNVEELLTYDSYKNSSAFQRQFSDKLETVMNLLNQYKSKDYIKSGKSVDEQRLNDWMRELYYTGYDYYNSSNNAQNYGVESTTAPEKTPYERYGREFDDSGVKEQFMVDYADKINKMKEKMIAEDLGSYESLERELNKTEGFSYYATDGTYVLTNTASWNGVTGTAVAADSFRKMPAYLIYEGERLTKLPASAEISGASMKNVDKNLESTLDDYYNPALKVYFSFDKHYLDAMETEFKDAKAEVVKWVPMTAICGVLALILLIYLIIITGRRDENGNLPVHSVDRIITELRLLIIGVLFAGGGFLFGRLLLESINMGVYYNGSLYLNNGSRYLSALLGTVSGLFSAGFGLYFILSVVRSIKAKEFFKRSLIFIVLSALWNGIKSVYFGGSPMKKVVLVTLAVCALSATVLLAPVAAALIIIFAPRWVKKFEEIKKGVDEVKNGNLSYKIKADGSGELDELAKGINEISEASSIAIQNELKNQRLKTDLISNVSHDLKTPLTSIITYIDLLKQEGLDSTDAPKYLEILDQKSIRLKKLTEDLFDAAKASSGAIPVRFEKVEMLSLINQGLGELGDKIENSGLEFKINAQKDKYYVHADGQLLWRVVENLLGNVLKYAQEGSRVYIDLKEQSGKAAIPNVILEIKNISKSELNIDADELMERFKRGDESRATEGSGLGLAIAKDLVRLQNGWFEIKIDGDLFKAVVLLEAYVPGMTENEPA